jgi:hypothetical protein
MKALMDSHFMHGEEEEGGGGRSSWRQGIAAAASSSGAVEGSADVLESIERLKSLLDSNAVTQNEFDAAKAKLLARL